MGQPRAGRRSPARLETVLLVGILLLAAALRLYRLGHVEPWWDEFLSLHRAMMSLPELLRGLANQAATEASVDTSPPLHHILIHYSLLLGKSAWAGRLPSLVFGTSSLAFVFLIGRDFLGRRTGVLAALYGALLLFHIAYCRDMRWYGVFYCFVTASPWFLLRAILRGRRGDWAGFVLTSAAMAYASYLAAPFLLGEGLWAGLTGLANWRRPETAATGRRQLLGLSLAVPAIGLLYLPQVHGHLVAYKTFYVPGVNVSNPGALWKALCQFAGEWHYLAPTFAGAGLVLAAWGLWKSWRRGRRFELLGLLAWGGTPTLVAFLVNVQAEVKPKYLVGLLFLFMLLAAAGADALADWVRRRLGRLGEAPGATLVLGLVLVVALAWPNLDSYAAFYRGPLPLYKRWALYLDRNQEDTDLLLLEHNRQRRVILEWFLKDQFHFLGERPTRAYRRFVYIGSKPPPAFAHPLATFVQSGETIRFSRAGVASLAPIPVAPDPSGRFVHAEDFHSLSVFENAWELDNLAPNFAYGILALHAMDRPGRLLYRLTAVDGARARGIVVRLGLLLSGKIRDLVPDARVRLAAGPAPEALAPVAEYGFETFVAQNPALDNPHASGDFEAAVTAPLPDSGQGARDLFVALTIEPGGHGAEIAVRSLELTARVPKGPAPDLAALGLAHLEANTRLVPWRPGIRPIAGTALHAFAADAHVPVLAPVGSAGELADFRKAHPGLPPVLTIPDAAGRPAYLIFDPLLLTAQAPLAPEPTPLDNPGPAFTPRGLLLRGDIQQPTLCLDTQRLRIPVAAPTGSQLRLNPGGQGLISLVPSYERDAFTVTNMIEHDHVVPIARGGAITCDGSGPCSFTYLFASQLPITGFRLLAFPNLANDGRQRVRAAYRLDNSKTYREIFTYRGGGNAPWAGIFEGLDRRVDLPRPAKLLFVRFELTGDGAQLMASDTTPMRLEIRLDASGMPPLEVPSGTFRLWRVPREGKSPLVWLSAHPLEFHENWVK